MKHLAVVTTLSDRDQARRLARTLVERKLAACAQISEIESFYVWDGAVQNEPELRVLFKTSGARYDEVVQAIKELHPYELPAIHAYACERIDAPYAQWIEDSTRPKR